MTQLNDQPAQLTRASRLNENAEIDLVDLLRALWRERLLIAGFAIGALVLAALYIWQANEVYRSDAGYAEPSLRQIQKMVPFPLKEFELRPQMLFDEFYAQLQSNRTRQQFFREFVWQGAQAEDSKEFFAALARFARSQSVAAERGVNGKLLSVTVSQQGSDPVHVAMLVDKYVELANDAAIRQVEQNFLAVRDSSIAQVQHQIEGLKYEADQAREQRIAKLRSAFDTAKALGLQESRASQAAGAGVVRGADSATMINLVEPPLYTYGTKELAAQVEALERVKGNYFDVEKLPTLESELAQLQKVTFNGRATFSYTERDAPIPVFEPIKPRKLLILALAGVAGLIFGVFVAMIMLAFRHRNEQVR